jgi:hypothetical protein
MGMDNRSDASAATGRSSHAFADAFGVPGLLQLLTCLAAWRLPLRNVHRSDEHPFDASLVGPLNVVRKPIGPE